MHWFYYVGKAIAMLWEMVHLAVYCFYDPISTVLYHGYWLFYLAEPTMVTIAVSVYALFVGVAWMVWISNIIVSFVVDIIYFVLDD